MGGMSAHAKTGRTATRKRHVLTRWQVFTIAALIALIGVGLATYAAAASYESVSHLAASRGVPLAWLNPAGLDGGLFGVIVLDIALTWTGQPLWTLRMVARVFAVGTIAANAAAGWPDPVGVGLRIAAPFLFVVLVEVARAILLRRNRGEDVPRFTFTRWVLAPRQTFAIWKRMKLWEDSTLPPTAVDAELAIVRLSERYGREWWKHAPADLVFMIRAGVHMDEALKRVAELTTLPQAEVPGGTSGRKPKRASARKPARKPKPSSGAVVPGPADLDTEAQALKILDAEPGISGSQLGLRLGKSDRYGRELIKKLAPVATSGKGQQ
jgi:Protein of unknown function (DUF2637)